MPNKTFALKPEQFVQLVENAGACLASDRITVDGAPVGFMYRETPDPNERHDGGWRFLAGDESDVYTSDPGNFEWYNVNTICNYDRAIIPYLGGAVGTAWGRVHGTDMFVMEPLAPPDEVEPS